MLTDAQKAEGWIAHDGGPCPVLEDVSIYCMLRCGIMGWAMRHAAAWERMPGPQPGTHYTNPTDIIAYRKEPT